MGASFEKTEKAIAEAEVVSFDIFDTLVKRNVSEPSEIFAVTESRYNADADKPIKDYRQKRIEAEKKARKHSPEEEITIREIYDFLPYSEEEKKKLEQTELETELLNCVPDLTMQRLFHQCRERHKHIVITSDMYLPEEIIRSILEKCGYAGYEKLYLSSVCKKTKSSGNIFALLSEEYAPYAGKIVHIGDHIKGDFISPKKKGIKAILIDGNKRKLHFWSPVCREFKTSYHYRRLYSMINNSVKEETSLTEKIGYEILGPVLYGFCYWLKEQLEKDGIERVFFLSREGKLLQRAYKELFPESAILQTYLYVSRQALLVPMLHQVKSYDELVDTLKCFLHIPFLKTIGKVCSLDGESFKKEIEKLGLREETEVYQVPEHLKGRLYDIIKGLGGEFFKEQYENVNQYLKDNCFAGNVAVVDIGWTGTMQRCLQHFADSHTNITGYYIGVKNLEKKDFYYGMKRKGYLFAPDENTEYALMIRFTLQVFESLFLNRDGSVRQYINRESTVIPCLAVSEYRQQEGDLIDKIQECAIDALRYLKEGCQGKNISVKHMMQSYKMFAVKPKKQVLQLFQKFCFLDGNVITLLPSQSLFYYCLHLKEFKRELNANVCKMWFFKWLFKINFPYYEVLKWASKCGMKSNYVGKFYDQKS